MSEEEARALRAEGLPVGTETARVLVADRVRHAWLHHGPDAARPDGAPPITAEDIANWRELIRAALDAQPTRTGSGQPAMTYLARDAQGRLVVIEEYRARTGVLAFSNMYRLPDGHGATRLDQVPGMRERLAAARGAPPVPNADPAAARSPEHTSATPGGLAQILPEAAGRFNVYTPTGRAVLVEPRVVPLSALVPSHGPDGTPNPAYPHAEGLQPRDRGAAPSRDQVRAIAAGLIPERLLPNVEAGMGAPIVHGSDNVVESGNGRVAALTLVHRDPALAHVREAYLAALERAGFDLARIEDPVLVSARVSQLSPAERIAFVREANLRGTAAETLTEAAARDAEAARGLLHLWHGGAVDAAANADFLRGFLARLTPEERAGLLDRAGRPLPALAARIERALLMAAYGDALGPIAARMIAGEAEGMRGLAAALRNLAGDWAAMRAEIEAGRVPAEYEATPALAEAVSAIAEAQARRLPLAELVLQADIERPGLTPSGLAMLRAMFPDGDLDRRIKPEVRLTEMLRGYVERARAADAGPMLLDLPPVRAADAIAAAARAEERTAPVAPRGPETSESPGQSLTIGHGGLGEISPPPRGAAGEAAPMFGPRRGAWPQTFPDVIAHGVHGIRRDADWTAAKSGDAAAALRLVERLARPEAAASLRQAVAGQNAVLVPVRQAERGGGDNLIPAIFARWLAAETGLPVEETVRRANRTMRTDADAFDRLLRRAAFMGEVEPGRAYVIVDDVVTQGGTVADLRGFIEAKGGRVIAVTALQAPGANARLALDAELLTTLRDRLGAETEAWWKETFGHDFTGLTASEARQLLRFADGTELRATLAGRLDALRRGSDDAAGTAGDDGPLPDGGAAGGRAVPRPQGPAAGGVAEPAAPRAAGEISPADPQAARLRAAAEEARRLARDPAAASAELLEAQRIAAERDLMIPEEAGARGARELLDAADDEAAEAAAAAACLIGAAA